MDNEITIIDENGKEITMQILFTWVNEESKIQYAFCVESSDDTEVQVFRVDEENNELIPVTEDDELDELEEVLNDFEKHQDDEIKEDN